MSEGIGMFWFDLRIYPCLGWVPNYLCVSDALRLKLDPSTRGIYNPPGLLAMHCLYAAVGYDAGPDGKQLATNKI
jgi:hypothetical protein